MIRILSSILAIWGCTLAADDLRLAVTTSFHNSGLSDVLLPAIADDTGINVQLLVVGTGQALRLGEAGDVDAILVHARAAEEAFVDSGFGTHRREIMYNDFVFIGPAHDPAGLHEAATTGEVLFVISRSQVPFVSRGDESGTHKREVALWDDAGISPEGDWYLSVGAGMGAALNTAIGMNAHILSDRASWLNFRNKSDFDVLFEGSNDLLNQYAYIPVNPARHDHVKHDLALQLENWLTSERARGLIDGYTINDEQLFTFNAAG